VRSAVATAKLRLLLGFDTAAGVHVGGIFFTDGTATVDQWDTITLTQTGSAAADFTVANVMVGVAGADFTGEARADNVRLDRLCK
jgi:hypothetical protein